MILRIILTNDSSFHPHMVLIIQNIFLIFSFSSIYGIFRIIFSIIDWQSINENLLRIPSTDDISCAANSSFPHFLSFLLCFFTFLLILERVYATHNYRSYEYTSWIKIIKQLFLFLWSPLPFIIFYNIFGFFNAKMTFHICELIEMNKTIYQRNTWIFFVAFFNIIFSAIFLHLYWKNVEHERNYLQYDYSTLSIRFQMKENLSTSFFMTKTNFLIFICFFFAIIIDYNGMREAQEASNIQIFIKRELWYLSVTMIHLLFPLIILYMYPKIYGKYKKWCLNYLPVGCSLR